MAAESGEDSAWLWLTIKDSQLAHRCDLRVPGSQRGDVRTKIRAWSWHVPPVPADGEDGCPPFGDGKAETKTMPPVTEAFMTARERAMCLVPQKPRTRVRRMRARRGPAREIGPRICQSGMHVIRPRTAPPAGRRDIGLCPPSWAGCGAWPGLTCGSRPGFPTWARSAIRCC